MDDDLLNALKPVPPPNAERILARLQARVHLEREAQSALAQASGPWRPFAPGIERQDVRCEGKVWSFLLRLAPGAALDGHKHWIDEASYCLQGRLKEADGRHVGPGDVREYPRGTHHAPMLSEESSLIYVRTTGIWAGPIRILANLFS